VISFFVLGPLIATFGENLTTYVAPAKQDIDETTHKDMGLIANMGPDEIYKNYLKYIGAGAVAAGGIIGMLRALPLIIASIVSGIRDLRSSGGAGGTARTERDLSMNVVFFGSIALVIVLAAIPQMGLGFTVPGILGAVMVLVFGFLFVTVSSRLTGEVGSSSNPISGMTIATLLLTCLVFVLIDRRDHAAMLTVLSIAAVVCIASSNGGTTSQDLKTGYLVGATPKAQQYAILVGALTSAVVIGLTMLAINKTATHYTKKGIPDAAKTIKVDVSHAAGMEKPGRPYDDGDLKDDHEYYVVHILEDEYPGVSEGRYLVAADGSLVYKTDMPIKRERKKMDNDENASDRFKAPQPELFATIIKGILGGKLQWALVIAGALIAVALELMAISALPVAVGMYLGLDNATPIFVGGMLRWLADRLRGGKVSEAEAETSPGVLLSSGYIAGGTLAGLIIAFLVFLPSIGAALNLSGYLPHWGEEDAGPKIVALVAFGVLGLFLLWIGMRRPAEAGTDEPKRIHT
jgi:uncharacterized oligopeptide transporter (OPT) family protein